MYDFCYHCGQTIGGQDQVVGQMLVCRFCGKEIGVVKAAPEKVVVDRTAEVLQSGLAARCPACSQVVEVKVSGAVRSLVPHFLPEKRRMCPGSGKPAAPPQPVPPAGLPTQAAPGAAVPRPAPSAPAIPGQAVAGKRPASKDLSAYMNREQVRVVACRSDADPTIEELNLEYLDKADRVRLQIEALRDILGKSFRMRPYPPALNRPHLAVWGNVSCCVVARKHAQGGYQPMTQEEMMQVVADLRANRGLFFCNE